MRLVAALLALSVGTIATPALADGGMYTFDNFPSATVGKLYHFAPDKAWLAHVRLSSGRIAQGCSASFISPDGLVMTNHHCSVGCGANLSTAQHNYVQDGFYAKEQTDEKVCPGLEIDRLDAITDVTAKMHTATHGRSGAALIAAEHAEEASLEGSCGNRSAVRCDVVSLYHGGVYDLYRYRRFTDVRLAFLPEFAIGQFGGDPDNFNFPRYGYDLSLLRVYANGKPASTPQYFKFSPNGSTDGELVFISGNPGSTERELTVSQLAYVRDVQIPEVLSYLLELNGELEQYQTQGPEQLRETREELFFLQNASKAYTGEQQAIDDPAFFKTLVAREAALRAAVAKRPALERAYGGAWAAIAKIQPIKRDLEARDMYIANGPRDSLFGWARTLVRLPVEKAKPEAQRLPEYSAARLVTLPRQLLAPVPVYSGPEELNLAYWATQMRRELGADDPFVHQVLGDKTPEQWAHDLVSGTKLADPAVRKALLDGGEAAIAASQDPMIRFVASIDAPARAARKQWETEVTAPETKYGEEIAKARFAVYGTSQPPDATFTPRLSYGTVKGFPNHGTWVRPYTNFAGLYARATGSPPFDLPPSWVAAKPSLDMATPLDLAATTDAVGGNSGSPMIDQHAQIVGLLFDGNIYSLGGAFGFDPRENRSVAVDSRAILAGLRSVYHADRLVDEITSASR